MTTTSTTAFARAPGATFDAGVMTLAAAPNLPTEPERNNTSTPSRPFLSDQGIVIAKTLGRTPSGFEVRLNELNASQKALYVRLADSGYTSAQINDMVTIIVRGGVDGLAEKYSQLSADNLASLSHIVNDLESETLAHDVSHLLLGNRLNISYGVSEFYENVGNALANTFLNMPSGIYETFSLSKDASGRPVISATPQTRQKVTDVFNSMSGNSRLIDSYFVQTFRLNSTVRVRDALDTALSAQPQAATLQARFDNFCSELAARGQLPVLRNESLMADLKKSFTQLDQDLKKDTPPAQRENLIATQSRIITETLVQTAAQSFKTIPDPKRFQFFADHIAMVIAMNNQSPNQISIPNENTSALFNKQWNKVSTASYDPVSGSWPLSKPGFLADYLAIRKQVREILGVPGVQTAPSTTKVAPQKTPQTTPPAEQPGPGATTSTTATPPKPKPKPKSDKGGYVQRPDAPQRGTIDDTKPLTSPLPRPKKAGPLHPPTRKPKADPKAGLFTSPRPTPGKPRHTGNTSPRPKHDPNPPRFPNISNVPEDRLPTKKPSPNVAPRNEFTWSATRAKPMPTATRARAVPQATRTTPTTPTTPTTRTTSTPRATRPQQTPSQRPAHRQGTLQDVARDLRTMSANGTPTLAQARAMLDRMKATMHSTTAQLEQQIKLLPALVQAQASAQLTQLQAAWDRWTPGALNNLEAFGKGASDNAAWALQLLIGFGAALQTLQTIGG